MGDFGAKANSHTESDTVDNSVEFFFHKIWQKMKMFSCDWKDPLPMTTWEDLELLTIVNIVL